MLFFDEDLLLLDSEAFLDFFSEAETACISCHLDVHEQTLGADCARCHREDNWTIDNITELHIENGFPLLGVHQITNCTDCHLSESALQFPRIG